MAGLKRGFTLIKKEMQKEATKEPYNPRPDGQLSLFTPEAFQGGDNLTLRQM